MKLTQNEIILWRKKIAVSLSVDRYSLGQVLARIGHCAETGQAVDVELKRFIKKLNHSCEQRSLRYASIPTIKYPEDLPIAERRDEIKEAILSNQVVIIAGETGSGKTTQLPKICLDLGRGATGLIGHTQPRRIAARTVASRIAEELGQPLGETVGYQVRFNETSSENTLVKLMTDGILLAEIQHDRYFSKYDTIIIDEAHERSLNIDFLLGYLKTILPKRPDLKLIITSATIDLEKFSQHFNDAPIIEVSGRTYPVDLEYIPVLKDRDLGQSILDAVEHILALPERGDILVFHSGEREIRETASVLRKAQLPHLDVVPLYARLSLSEQTKVFSPHKGIRIVLATNVAETSLTVPGIRYVIDPGTARISRYSYRTKVQRLPIEPISQASANQRKGRCGRTSNGTCFRLYSEEDFNGRPSFTDPEIIRTNLASVILKMLNLKIGDIRDFSFLESPDNRLINDGYSLLQELQAVTKQSGLTEIGRKLCRIPTDPKLGRMLLAAEDEGALKEVLIIISALSVQDPRDRPPDSQEAADLKHRQWKDKESDFSTLVNLWRHFEEQRQDLSRNQFDRYCRQNFVSPLRMREWRELHHQLHGICRELKIKENPQPAGYEAIHRSLLHGLLGQIGCRRTAVDSEGAEKKQEKISKEFTGTRNRKFYVFPGSSVSKAPPPWLMSAEMIETSRLFSHHNAKIDPSWLPTLAAHLVKKTYSEPHYSVRNGQVMAYEKQTLYGLLIVDKKRCAYGKINPVISREIFIRAALVEGGYRGKGKFFDHNLKLQDSLLNIESRTRRRDILVDDSVIFDFYDRLIPEDIVTLSGFEAWRKIKEQALKGGALKFLHMSADLLSQDNHCHPDISEFPDTIEWDGVSYLVSYHFEPGHVKDGVTVTVPIGVLHQVPMHLFEWLVPGMLRDKCIALVRGLSKPIRRNFVPVPDYVDKALESLKPSNVKLTEALGIHLKLQAGIDIQTDDWNQAFLDNIYRINFELIDESSCVLAMSKDLVGLKTQYREKISDTLARATTDTIEKKDLKDWEFEDLPEVYLILQKGLTIRAYPALVVEENVINLTLLDNQELATNRTLYGLTRLHQAIDLASVRYLKKGLLNGMDLQLKLAGLGGKEGLIQQIIDKAYFLSFLEGQVIPRNKSDFESRHAEGKNKVVSAANELDAMVSPWTSLIADIRREMKKHKLSYMETVQDIDQQLNMLFCDRFLFQTPMKLLQQYHRYLKSILCRLEKLHQNTNKEQSQILEIQDLENRLIEQNKLMGESSLAAIAEFWEHRLLLQEYRVSIFSQALRTVVPVSRKRINLHWKKLQNLI